MKSVFGSVFAAIAITAVALAAEGAKTIDAEELSRLLDKKEVYFIDVREPSEIKELGSVKGYANIPVGQIESRLSEIPKNKLIVTL